MMARRTFLVALGALTLALPVAVRADEADDVAGLQAGLRARLRSHVEVLAGEDLHGRGDWADREKAAAYIANAFEDAGLQQLPGHDAWFLDDGTVDGHPRTRNVLGWLPPSTSEETSPKADTLLLSASYDHHGIMEGKVFPGADDNATGVAALIETARALAADEGEGAGTRRHAVLVVAFDLREQHQTGSRSFADRPPLPLDRCLGHVSLETLGRSFGGAVPGGMFAMGTEHCALFEALVDAQAPPKGGRVYRLSTQFHYEPADYFPFRDRKVPFLFLVGGPTADHDRPEDTPDKIQWSHLEARTLWVTSLLRHLLAQEKTPAWREAAADILEDYRTLDVILTGLKQRLTEEGATDVLRRPVDTVAAQVKKYLAAGGATPQERRQLYFMIMAGLRMIPLLERAAREGRASEE